MAAIKVAVLGIDQVGHGTRRGTETADPSLIFFNFTILTESLFTCLFMLAIWLLVVRIKADFATQRDFLDHGIEHRPVFFEAGQRKVTQRHFRRQKRAAEDKLAGIEQIDRDRIAKQRGHFLPRRCLRWIGLQHGRQHHKAA